MPAHTNTAGVEQSTPSTTAAAKRHPGGATLRRAPCAQRRPNEEQREERVQGVRLELGGVPEQAGRARGQAEGDEGLEVRKHLSGEGDQQNQQGAGRQQRYGAQRELVRAAERDDRALEPEEGHGSELAVVERRHELAIRPGDDAAGEHRLVAPQGIPSEVLQEPEDEAPAERGREQPPRDPVGVRSIHPWSAGAGRPAGRRPSPSARPRWR